MRKIRKKEEIYLSPQDFKSCLFTFNVYIKKGVFRFLQVGKRKKNNHYNPILMTYHLKNNKKAKKGRKVRLIGHGEYINI
jgi:hypothetical protein